MSFKDAVLGVIAIVVIGMVLVLTTMGRVQMGPEQVAPASRPDAQPAQVQPTDAATTSTLKGSTLSRLSRAAMQMHAQFRSASGDVPASAWPPAIRDLHPIRVYWHRLNLVVVLKEEGGVEQGKYIYNTISSFYPNKPVDGFEWTDLGNHVFNYHRKVNTSNR